MENFYLKYLLQYQRVNNQETRTVDWFKETQSSDWEWDIFGTSLAPKAMSTQQCNQINPSLHSYLEIKALLPVKSKQQHCTINPRMFLLGSTVMFQKNQRGCIWRFSHVGSPEFTGSQHLLCIEPHPKFGGEHNDSVLLEQYGSP